MVTVHVKRAYENDNKSRMEEVNKDLRLEHLEEFSSKITKSERERVEMQDEERDLFDRHTRIDRANHNIVFYCFLTIVILLPCILLSYIYIHKK